MLSNVVIEMMSSEFILKYTEAKDIELIGESGDLLGEK